VDIYGGHMNRQEEIPLWPAFLALALLIAILATL
jgi:hypothetical protein